MHIKTYVNKLGYLARQVIALLVLVNISHADAGAKPLTSPQLGNQHLEMAFDADAGYLSSVRELKSGHNCIDGPTSAGLWTLRFAHIKKPVTIHDAKAFTWKQIENGLELRWSGFAELEGVDVLVTVILLPTDRYVRCRLLVEGPEKLVLHKIHFPQIPAIAKQDDEVLAVPHFLGRTLSNPRGAFAYRHKHVTTDQEFYSEEWEAPGHLSAQFITLYQDAGPGLFIACDDTRGYGKWFTASGNKRRVFGFDVSHFPNESSKSKGVLYEMPYSCFLGTFQGDWFTLAEMYREWDWVRAVANQSPLVQKAAPPWIVNTGLWVWNRGRSDGVLQPAADLHSRTGLPVNVLWHWWHGCPYDVGFPEYLPPREGAEPFREAVKTAQERDIHMLVYMNMRGWGTSTDSWRTTGAEKHAVRNEDGSIHLHQHVFADSQRASMCLDSEDWRKRYTDLACFAVRDLGVDGIYMDQSCENLFCYDPSHNHPRGGGNSWIKGFRLMESDIRRQCNENARGGDVALAGEGCNEDWLSSLDAMLTLQVSQERYIQTPWNPAPIFPFIYGGKTILFGNYASLTAPPFDELWPKEFSPENPLALLDRKFSLQFRLEHARAFAWGLQPMIANYRPEQMETRAEEMDFFIRLAQLRHNNLRYFQHGLMLRTPNIDVPQIKVLMSRLSIYAGQRDGGRREFTKSSPAVIASAWQSKEGAIGVTFVNISNTQQAFPLQLTKETHPLPLTGTIYKIDGDGRTQVGTFKDGTIDIPVELSSQRAMIYEVIKAK